MGTWRSMSVSILVDGAALGPDLLPQPDAAPRPAPGPHRLRLPRPGLRAPGRRAGARRGGAAPRARSARSSRRLLGSWPRRSASSTGWSSHPRRTAGLAAASGCGRRLGRSVPARGRDAVTRPRFAPCIAWLTAAHGGNEVFATDALATAFTPAAAFADVASGLLAISISQGLHELRHLVPAGGRADRRWGGDPTSRRRRTEPASRTPAPAASFETWKETVRGRSLPWAPVEVDAARDLRNAVVGIVLRRAEELARMTRAAAALEQGAGGVLVLGQPRPAGAVPAHRRLRRAAARPGRRAPADDGRRYVDASSSRPFRPARWSTTCSTSRRWAGTPSTAWTGT